MPITDRLERDLSFPANNNRNDLLDQVCAAMNVDCATAQLGWKTNDDGSHAAQELKTVHDVDQAFATLTHKTSTLKGSQNFINGTESVYIFKAPECRRRGGFIPSAT